MLESKLVSWYQVLGEHSIDQEKLNSRIEVIEEIYKNAEAFIRGEERNAVILL